jgi:hypothetical protein
LHWPPQDAKSQFSFMQIGVGEAAGGGPAKRRASEILHLHSRARCRRRIEKIVLLDLRRQSESSGLPQNRDIRQISWSILQDEKPGGFSVTGNFHAMRGA